MIDARMKKMGVLMTTAGVDMLGGAMVFPLLPFYALRFHASETLIGWMFATFWAAQLASAPLWGRVSDRYGRRPALLIGLAASAAGFLVFAFATNIWMLFLSRLVQGAGGGTTGVAHAYVGDAIEKKDRAKALGWLSAATSVGIMFGPVLGSLATNISPEGPGLIAALLCVINVAFAWRWLPESKPVHTGQAQKDDAALRRRGVREVVFEVLGSPRNDVPRLIWVYTVGMLGFMSLSAVMALYLGARFGVTEKTIGLFFFYTGSLSLVMRALVIGKLVERFGETGTLRLGSILLTLGLFLTPLAHTIPLFALAAGLIPLGTACLFPATSALVTHRAPKHELGQVLGVQQAFGGAARIVAPIWSTFAFQHFGRSVPFFVSSVVVAGVSVLAFRIREEKREDDGAAAKPVVAAAGRVDEGAGGT